MPNSGLIVETHILPAVMLSFSSAMPLPAAGNTIQIRWKGLNLRPVNKLREKAFRKFPRQSA